jgi:membrane associated rhomboid family serine protease
MGIHDRDYYRDDSGRDSTGLSVTVGLIALHVGLFFLLALSTNKTDDNELIRWGGFRLEAVLHGEIWRLVTSQLIPVGNLITIVIGMFLLYWAGKPIEAIYGPRAFLAFYFAAALIAGITKLVFGITGLVPHPSEIGIPAPLFAVMILFACHFPRQIILLFFILPVQVGHLVAVLLGLYLFSSILSFVNGGKLLDAPSVLAAAAFAGFFFSRGAKWFASWSLPGIRPRASRPRRRDLRLYTESELETAEPAERPEPVVKQAKQVDEHLEAKLDEVLEKLAKFGPERLTREENEVLMKASEAYQRLRK